MLIGRITDVERTDLFLKLREVHVFLCQFQIRQIHIGLLKAPVPAEMVNVPMGVHQDQRQVRQGFGSFTDIGKPDGCVDDQRLLFSRNDVACRIVVVQQPYMVIDGHDFGLS